MSDIYSVAKNKAYEDSDSVLVTVVTCIYNRADTIHRVTESMLAQTYDNFEHILVDDGSTDNIDEKLADYIENAPFPVMYIKKSNGGKHTATNVAWSYARGKYVVNFDSDDRLLPHALEFLVGLWNEIPENKRDEYWAVLGRCMDERDNAMVGGLYPENINQLPEKKKEKARRKVVGDKIGMQRLDYVKTEMFKEPKGVKFVNEASVWFVMNKKYKTYYSNEVVRVYYHDSGNRISDEKYSKQTNRNRLYNNWYGCENGKRMKIGFKQKLDYFLRYGLYYYRADKEFKAMHKFKLSNPFKQLAFYVLSPLFIFKTRNQRSE